MRVKDHEGGGTGHPDLPFARGAPPSTRPHGTQGRRAIRSTGGILISAEDPCRFPRVAAVSGDDRRRTLRAVPLTLALAMLAVVVLAGLLPDTGVVSASSNCTYGKCPAATPFPLWAVSAAVVVVVVALLLALLLLRRNRRRPPAASSSQEGTVGSGTAAAAPAESWTQDQDGTVPDSGDESAPQGSPDGSGEDGSQFDDSSGAPPA